MNSEFGKFPKTNHLLSYAVTVVTENIYMYAKKYIENVSENSLNLN